MENSIFHEPVPDWVEKVCIILLVCSQIMISGIPANAIAMVTSFLGDEKDAIQFIYYGGVVGSASAYPLIGRFLRYFRKRQLLLLCISLELILLVISVFTKNNLQLFVVNFLLSSVKMVCLMTCLGLFLKKFNPTNSRGLMYGMYYALSFSLSQLYSYWVAVLLQSYSWKYTFLISLPGIFVSFLIVVVLMHTRRIEKKYPLYQIDWLGYFLFIASSLGLSYVCIFGERLYWLQDNTIRLILAASIVGYVLWTIRMLIVRRPYVDVRVLAKYSHVRVGVALMIALFFIYNTFSISTEFMKVNLGYTDSYVAATNLYLIISFVIFIPLTGIWLHKVHRVRESLFVGFALFAIYYLYTARFFYPEENSTFFLIPMMLRGAAYGISITSLSYYASVNLVQADNTHRAFFSIISRSVIAAPITSALWLDSFNYFKQKEYDIVSAQFGMDDYRVSGLWKSLVSSNLKSGSSLDQAEQLAQGTLHNMIYKEALIMSAQNVYYLLAAISIALAILVLFLKVLNVHYVSEKNKYQMTYMDV
ncbi:MFS transporter [Kaistella flava (ex Peng et al. 2021)]|uniref:MFS transporter n=1 Tax=Kaistella flava (ex Peng et al. 2021) TaxID=2038776 RepID=A0A7M2Y9B5_9FLAO|nr:MFS transporter [Kaistella flava (ex Peng et al. 2021)]QOW10857.1 MFS transporter [Kaistella flava (ex Peng et al. 2021)]